MENVTTQEVSKAAYVFDTWFLDTRKVYHLWYQAFPNICLVPGIDGEKAYKAIMASLSTSILQEFQYREFETGGKEYGFGKTIIVMSNRVLLELNQGYCEIFHDGCQPDLVLAITRIARACKHRQKRRPLEMNLIVQGRYGFELKAMEVKRTRLDLALYYEDDFQPVHETICKKLNQKKGKGIVLLHGLPGTGKTSYLRYLVGRLRKRVMFLSPTVAAQLTDPSFIELLIDNPETILVIEDAEKIITDRKHTQDSAVSGLLNISDGLLADCLNVQIVCTFNSELTLIDKALLRKGRLIAQYAFGKLCVEKAQRLSNFLGFDQAISRPMTLAEIGNPHEPDTPVQTVQVLGFRREIVEN